MGGVGRIVAIPVCVFSMGAQTFRGEDVGDGWQAVVSLRRRYVVDVGGAREI